MIYREEDFLQLAGVQHFAFCRRQWALIHLEQQWAENRRTVEGELLHERCHDDGLTEKRGDTLIVRGMRIHSAALGVSGACDVVEFHASPDGVPLAGREGTWQAVPVEYKRGKPKAHDADALQLCGQAICLEEMLACEIDKGYLYYGETRRRQEIVFTEDLRAKLRVLLEEMHGLAARGHTPRVKPAKACSACSLQELCLPRLYKRRQAADWVRRRLGEEDGL